MVVDQFARDLYAVAGSSGTSGAVTYWLGVRDALIETSISRLWTFESDHNAQIYVNEIVRSGPILEENLIEPSIYRNNVWYATIRVYAQNCGFWGRAVFHFHSDGVFQLSRTDQDDTDQLSIKTSQQVNLNEINSQRILVYNSLGDIIHNHEFLYHENNVNLATIQEFERMAVKTAKASLLNPRKGKSVQYSFPDEFEVFRVPSEFKYNPTAEYKFDFKANSLTEI